MALNDPAITSELIYEQLKHHSPYFWLEQMVFLTSFGVDDNDFISGYRQQYDKSLELFNRTVGADSSASQNGFFGTLMILLIGFY